MENKKSFIICGLIIVLAFVLVHYLQISPNLSKDVQFHFAENHKLGVGILNKFISYAVETNHGLDMSSGEALAKMLANTVKIKNQSNSFILKEEYSDDIIFSFECSDNKSCIAIVDVNGKKGPNKITRNAKDLQDKAMYKIIKRQNGTYEVLKPKWWNELERLEY